MFEWGGVRKDLGESPVGNFWETDDSNDACIEGRTDPFFIMKSHFRKRGFYGTGSSQSLLCVGGLSHRVGWAYPAVLSAIVVSNFIRERTVAQLCLWDWGIICHCCLGLDKIYGK